jgi:2-dehydropantoate 2-reductase
MADAIDQHRPLMRALAGEVLAVAHAQGIQPLGFDGFEPDVIGSPDATAIDASFDRLVAIRRTDQKTHSGVWRDLAVRKRRTEVDAHFLPIVAEAERRGIEVPILRRLIALMHEIEDGQRELSSANLEALASVHA